MEEYQGLSNWYLLLEREDGATAKFPIPDKVAGKITEDTVRCYDEGKSTDVPDKMRDYINEIKNLITIEAISKLTDIAFVDLIKFMDGESLLLNSDQAANLGNVVGKLMI